MANITINSEHIQVFPCVNRTVGSGLHQQTMVSEYSISSIVNKFIDTKGFIITKEDSDLSVTGLQFNIHGYYFDISPDGISAIRTAFSGSDQVWAYITVQQLEEGKAEFNDLIGKDEGTDFTGLHLVDSKQNMPKIASAADQQVKENVLPNDTTVYWLLLLIKDKTVGSSTFGELIINSGSRRKFNLDTYGYQILDGGTITA